MLSSAPMARCPLTSKMQTLAILEARMGAVQCQKSTENLTKNSVLLGLDKRMMLGAKMANLEVRAGAWRA